MTELTILLPTLNEAESLPRLLPALKKALEDLGVSWEILIVDGGSRDGTPERARELGARVMSQRVPGFGSALREGFAAARGAYILAMDADGSHPFEVLPRLWARREENDLVIASRFIPGGSALMSRSRYALSWLLNKVSRCVLDLPVKDSSSGLRLYRAGAVRDLPLRYRDFAVQQEILVRILADGGKVEEIAFRYDPRLGGRSKARVLPLAASYLRMLFEIKVLREGWRPLAGLGAVLALGLITGLWGIGWGLPGPARLRAFPEGLRPTPEIAQKFADAWADLYREIRRSHEEMRSEEPVTYVKGVEEFPAGWSFPPAKLLNSYRSLLLQSENPDEKKVFIILSQMRPWKLQFEPLYVQYGGAFVYPLGVFLAAASGLGAARLVPGMAHYLLHPEDMRRLYLCGRVFILFFHLGALWILYNIGRRLAGPGVGLCTAVFFALCPIVVTNAHFLKPHPYAAFWALAACLLMLDAVRTGERRRYLGCGLCAGMAAGANLSFVFFAGLPALAWLARPRPARRPEAMSALQGMASAVGLCLAMNPYLLLSYRSFAWETQVYSPPTINKDLGLLVTAMPGILAAGMGPLLAALGVAGWARALAGPEPRRRLLALAGAGVSAVLWLRFGHDTTMGSLRLYYPMVGLTCFFAADLIAALPRSLAVVVLAGAFADTGLRGFVYLENMRQDAGPRSTYTQAADWIEAHVPPGASLGLTRYPEPAHTPPFRYDRYDLVVFEDPAALTGPKAPDYVVVDEGGMGLIDKQAQNNYDCVVQFSPFQAGWARALNNLSFANGGFYVFRRREAAVSDKSL